MLKFFSPPTVIVPVPVHWFSALTSCKLLKNLIFILRCLVRPVETTQNRTWRHLNDIPMQIGGLCLNGFHDVVGANVFSVLLNKNVAPQRGVWNSTTMRLMLPCYVHQSRLTEDSKTCIFSMYIDLVQAKTESFFIYF